VVDFFVCDPKVGKDLLVWNGLVMLRPFARFRERIFLFCRDWFVVNGSVREGPGDGIEHGFEQADDGGELRRRKPLDQFVGLLFLVCGTVSHGSKSSEICRSALAMGFSAACPVLLAHLAKSVCAGGIPPARNNGWGTPK
jgi:hypothetical protein